jgi:MFS family permease
MACRKFGPRIWLSFLTAGFGLTTFSLSFVSSYRATMFLRVLLGCFESGIQPGIMYLYAQFYRRHELVSRWGIKASMASVAGCFGGLLASGLSHIPEAGMLNGWRWIFFIEALLTAAFAFIVFMFLPDSVSEAHFLSESDRQYAAERIRSETMTKEDPQDLLSFRRALLNWNTQLLAFVTTCSLMTMSALSFFMVHSILFSYVNLMLMVDSQLSFDLWAIPLPTRNSSQFHLILYRHFAASVCRSCQIA